MKQVNFKELNTEVKIGEFETIDLRHEVGNAIHRQAISVPISELAKGIYYSEKAIEISDADYAVLLTIIEKSFAILVLNAVKSNTKDIKEEEVSHD